MLGADWPLRSISDIDSDDPSVWRVSGKIIGSASDDLAIRRPGRSPGKKIVREFACGEFSLLGAIRSGYHQRGFSAIRILAHKGNLGSIGRKSNMAVNVRKQLLLGFSQ